MDVDEFVQYLVVGLVLVGCYLYFVRRPIRAERLRSLRKELGRLGDAVAVGTHQAQAQLLAQVEQLRSAQSAASLAETRARTLPLARPDAPLPNDTEESLLTRLAQVASDNRVVLGAAGTEQFVANLFDMAQPDALQHLGEACKLLGESGMVGIIIEGARHGLHGAATEFASHVGHAAMADLVHGAASDIVHIPAEMVHHVVEAGHHVGHAFNPLEAHGAHFPWITLALSTVREGALLLEDRTTIGTAVGHVLLDTGATAAGSLGGAKAGALAGSAIAPGIGTAVGAVVGAILGGMGGRFVSTKIKFMPLKRALEAYDDQLRTLRSDLHGSARSAVCNVVQHSVAAEQHLHQSIPPIPRSSDVLGCREINDGTVTRIRQIHAEFAEMRKELSDRLQALQDSVPMSLWYHYLFLTGVEDEGAELVQKEYEQTLARIEHLERKVPLESDITSDPLRTLTRLARIELPLGTTNPQRLNWWTEMVKRTTQAYLAMLGTWSVGVATAFRVESESVLAVVAAELVRHRAVFEAGKGTVEQKHAAVTYEQRKLGLA